MRSTCQADCARFRSWYENPLFFLAELLRASREKRPAPTPTITVWFFAGLLLSMRLNAINQLNKLGPSLLLTHRKDRLLPSERGLISSVCNAVLNHCSPTYPHHIYTYTHSVNEQCGGTSNFLTPPLIHTRVLTQSHDIRFPATLGGLCCESKQTRTR